MIWDFWRKKQLEEAGALARRQHSEWLTRALASGKAFPRIPTRRVDKGGFQGQMERKAGPGRAETWWRLALERVPNDESE
jgi:hypothetical protein